LSKFETRAGTYSRQWSIYSDAYIKYPEDVITPIPRSKDNISRCFYDNNFDEADVYHIHSTYGLPEIVKSRILPSGKPIYLHYHGSYLRMYGGSKTLNNVAKYIFVSTPDLLQYIPKKYSDKTFFVPNPVSIDPYYVCSKSSMGDVRVGYDDELTILHTTTNVGIKGTRPIMNGIRFMKNNYNNINILLCKNKTHWESLQMMKISDIYVDQFNIGCYGVAAIEAMLLGNVVLAWIDPNYGQFYPGCTIKSCDINGFVDALKATLFDYDTYKRTEKQRIAWASTFHSPKKIGEYYKNIYEGMVPKEDPNYYLRWKE